VVKAFMIAPTTIPPIEVPPPLPSSREIRELMWRMHSMFASLFSVNLQEQEAENRATGYVMDFLSILDQLDIELHPDLAKPIWIAKYNLLGLIRCCGHFKLYRHLKNLYEGGVDGEGGVKPLRDLAPSGVKPGWSVSFNTNINRHTVLEIIQQINKCKPTAIEPSAWDVHKFRRYKTRTEVTAAIDKGLPISVIIFGGPNSWIAGFILGYGGHWFFQNLDFNFENTTIDPCGFDYHSIDCTNEETTLNEDPYHHPISTVNGLSFWGYGILLPDLLQEYSRLEFQYAIVKKIGNTENIVVNMNP
jgi:hypothetical protein